MTTFPIKKTWVVILIIFTFFVGLVFLVFLFLAFYFYRNSNDIETKFTKTYQYSEIDIPQHTTNRGFVQLNKNLRKSESITYSNEETGSFVIISNLGGTEYECTGTCTCTNERRTAAAILNRGFVVLLSAFSASMALQLAKETFRDQCLHAINKQSDWTCEEKSVNSVVEDCKKRGEEVFDSEEKFECTGHCVSNNEIDKLRHEYVDDGNREFGLCESIKLTRAVKPKDNIRPEANVPKVSMVVIKTMFSDILMGYCRETTRLKLRDSDEQVFSQDPEKYGVEDPAMQEVWKDTRNGIPFCFGYSTAAKDLNNIECVKISN